MDGNKVIIQGEYELKHCIRYEVDPSIPPLGEGGCGIVRKGFQVDEKTGHQREVAIKFLFDDLIRTSPEVIHRAVREASVQITHENLVEMIAFVKTGEESLYGSSSVHYHVVSELLRGVMLYDFLNGNIKDKDGNIYPFVDKLYNLYASPKTRNEFALTIIKNVLSGIMTLHDHGYIHRDIDPSNIMLTEDGKVKLIDFGICKKMKKLHQDQDRCHTSAGQFIGKAAYAAPELVRGDVAHQNATTDVYAIGILLYQMVTGELPFKGSTDQVCNMQIRSKIPLHNIKDRKIRLLIKKATQKEQNKRFDSAVSFRLALEPPPPIPVWEYLMWILGAIAALGLGVLLQYVF